MRILVYGAGVLGGTLAANLAKAKKDVTLLARGDKGKDIEENGLTVENRVLHRKSTVKIKVISSLQEDDVYDVIFVVVRYTQLDAVMEVLQRNPSRTIVLVGNNLKPKEYKTRLPGKYVMFAFYLAAGHREGSKICGIDLKKITIGNLKEDVSNEIMVKEIFSGTGIKVKYETNMEDYLISHAVFVLPAAFACFFTNGNLKRIVGNKFYLNRMADATVEGYRAIESGGHVILPETDQDYESPKARRALIRFYRLMAGTPLGKICAADHALNAAEEMAALNEDLKAVFDQGDEDYDSWQMLESETNGWLIPPYTGNIRK